jgi:hypothetical protein
MAKETGETNTKGTKHHGRPKLQHITDYGNQYKNGEHV